MASIPLGNDFRPEKFMEEARYLLNRIDLDGMELDYDGDNMTFILPILKSLQSNASNKTITMSLSAKLLNSTQYDNLKLLTGYLDMVVIQPIFYSYAKVNKSKEDFRRISDLETLASVIDDVLSWGVPRSKILVTLSTFGIRTELEPSLERIKSSIRVPYTEICIDRRNKNWTLQREMDQTSPFIANGNIRQAFDDEISLKLKSKYILLRKLGGVQISSIHEDDHSNFCKGGHYPLIRSIYQVMMGVKSNKSSIDNLKEYMEPSETKTFLKRSGIAAPYDQDLECTREGYYQNPFDCGKFYRCVKFHQFSDEFTVFHYECPHGLVFDERYEVCNWPSWSERCAGSGEVVDVPKNKFVCPGVGYFRDRENCRWFYYCSEFYYDNGVPSAYEFKCPYNLAYDEEKHICNWRWLVPGCGYETSAKWNSQNPFPPKELGVIYEKPKGTLSFDPDFDKFLQKPEKEPILPIDPDFDKFHQKPEKEPIIPVDPELDKLIYDKPDKIPVISVDDDLDKLIHFSKQNKPRPEPLPEQKPDPEPLPEPKHPNLEIDEIKGFNPGSYDDGIGKLHPPLPEPIKEVKPPLNPLYGIPDQHHWATPHHYPNSHHHIDYHSKRPSLHSHSSSWKPFDRLRNMFHGLFGLITTGGPISFKSLFSHGPLSHLSKLISNQYSGGILTIPLLEEKPPVQPPVNIFIINNGNKFERISPHLLTPGKLQYESLIKDIRPPSEPIVLKQVPPESAISKEPPPPPPEPVIPQEPPPPPPPPEPVEPEPPIVDKFSPIKAKFPLPDDPEPPIEETTPPKRPEKQIYYGPPDILPLPRRPDPEKSIDSPPPPPPPPEVSGDVRQRPIKYYNHGYKTSYHGFKDLPEKVLPEPEPIPDFVPKSFKPSKYDDDCKDVPPYKQSDRELPPSTRYKFEKYEEIRPPPQRPEPEIKSHFRRPDLDSEIIPPPPKHKFYDQDDFKRPYFRPDPESKEISRP
ncbi:uncharacterized protein [Centruroides vittatus]|uniref:uncharacterized protein n=1 Tax=Centruroides vittatus TaxID=120091 RepID=UPI003510C5C9